jgi:hypothetical protein
MQEGSLMALTVWGIVKNGIVKPLQPLPEGIAVQITVPDGPMEFTPEEQEEFDAWALASAQALELVERLAEEGPADEQR